MCPLCGGRIHRDADGMIRRCDRVTIERFPMRVGLRELWLSDDWPTTGPDPDEEDEEPPSDDGPPYTDAVDDQDGASEFPVAEFDHPPTWEEMSQP